jgi:hypothetical protein
MCFSLIIFEDLSLRTLVIVGCLYPLFEYRDSFYPYLKKIFGTENHKRVLL